MQTKVFLLERGQIFISDGQGNEINFSSIADFNRYYSGTIALSPEIYIDYEPLRRVFYYRADDSDYSPLVNGFTGALPEYEAIIADAAGMKAKLEDPYYMLDLEPARSYRMQQLRIGTYSLVVSYMPEWKQFSWSEYVRLHEKKAVMGTLAGYEKILYESFPEGEETFEGCYEDAQSALTWILECRAANNAREQEIYAAGSIAAVKAVGEPEYPAFPLV